MIEKWIYLEKYISLRIMFFMKPCLQKIIKIYVVFSTIQILECGFTSYENQPFEGVASEGK